MLTLISQKQIKDSHGQNCDLLESAYATYFHSHGITVIPVSNASTEIDFLLQNLPQISGIILSGGNDMNQRAYEGISTAAKLDTVPERDNVENLLVTMALEQGIPVLGICRGMQFLNVYFGGTLLSDIPKAIGKAHPPAVNHSIDFVEARVADYLKTQFCEVNSYHQHAVTLKTLSPELHPFALASGTEIVEGLYHPHYAIAGVQFHPERDRVKQDATEDLIKAFKNAELFWSKVLV